MAEFARSGAARRPDLLTPLEELVGGSWDMTTRLPEQAGDATSPLVNRLLAETESRLNGITTVTVGLAEATPRLSGLAGSLASAADEQAARSGAMATATAGMARNVGFIADLADETRTRVDTVSDVAGQLAEQSSRMTTITSTVTELARQASVVAINAAVEAARLGAEGHAFAVIAAEMRLFAERVAEANREAGELLGGVDALVRRAAAMLGTSQHQEGTLMAAAAALQMAAAEEETEVQRVSEAVDEVAEAAKQQAISAEQVAAEGVAVGDACDELIVHVGQFRLRAQAAARPPVEQLAARSALASGDRRRLEAAMRAALCESPFLELLYATDLSGRQVTANIAPDGFQAAYGSDGYGSDWSQRPWFTDVVANQRTQISEVYRSAASDGYCFTVSTPLRDEQGAMVGVLGADVDLRNLLSLMTT